MSKKREPRPGDWYELPSKNMVMVLPRHKNSASDVTFCRYVPGFAFAGLSARQSEVSLRTAWLMRHGRCLVRSLGA